MTAPLHMIDTLIAERAPRLFGPTLGGRLARRLLYPFLGYRQAVALADAMQGRSGFEALEVVSETLHLALEVTGAEYLPRTGPALLVANHPTGIADGIAVFDLLKAVRPDFMIFANRDAVRIAPALEDVIIPVEWRASERSRARMRETLSGTRRAFAEGRLVVVFPSGRLAYRDRGQLRERPWQSTALSLARRHQVPIIPMHLGAQNSPVFYGTARLSDQLRDITLFYEVMNKKGAAYRMTLAPPLAPEPWLAESADLGAATEALAAYVGSAFRAPRPGLLPGPEHDQPRRNDESGAGDHGAVGHLAEK
jgi:putative hemolysin